MHKNFVKHKANITREENDLTSGNLFKKMVFFAIPILLTSILTMLFSTVDLFTVSKFGGGNNSMAAIGANMTVINIIICLFLGFSVGANIVVGNAKGKGDKVTAFRATQSSLMIAFFFGIIIAVTGWFIAEPLLNLVQTPKEVMANAVLYLRVYLLGSPLFLVFNFGSSILRAYGDSKRPLYALLAAGVFNIILDILFVAVFKMDVLGVAIATVVAHGVAAIAVILFLKYDKRLYVNFTFKRLKFYKDETLEVMKLGITSGLQSLVFNITNLIIQASINGFGAAVLAGSTAAVNIEDYQYYFLNAISTTTMAMISQNNGAKKKENVIKVLKIALILNATVVTGVGLIIFLLREPLCKIFLDEADPNFPIMLETATTRLTVICLTYCLCGFMETLSGYYRGLKYSLFPTIVTILGTAIFRIVFIYTLFQLDFFHNIGWLLATYPISWALTSTVYFCFLPHHSKKIFATYSIKDDLTEHKKILAKYEE